MTGLTKKQDACIQGVNSVVEDIESEICEYCIDECSESMILERMECEIAQDVLRKLLASVVEKRDALVEAYLEDNAYRAQDMSYKKAKKKFGKSFVKEVWNG